MFESLVTEEVSQPSSTYILLAEEQPLNIPNIDVTFPVLKLLRSNIVSAEQFWNIVVMLVTLLVSNEPKLRRIRLVQPLNIDAIFVTLEVSKLSPISRFLRLVQPLNKLLMSVTLLVLSPFIPGDLRALQLKNIEAISVTLLVL